MRIVVARIASLLAILLAIATALSLVPGDVWWIQELGFPRILALIAIAMVALGCLAAYGRWPAGLLAILVVAAALQLWQVYPYVPFAPVEVATARTVGIGPDASCFTVLGSTSISITATMRRRGR